MFWNFSYSVSFIIPSAVYFAVSSGVFSGVSAGVSDGVSSVVRLTPLKTFLPLYALFLTAFMVTVYVGLFFLFLIFLNTFQKENLYIIKHRIIDGLALFCLYSAMQAPAIYANVGVTAGVDNMNYQVFLFMSS